MAENDQPKKRPASPRAETMQPSEARQRYYLPDYDRSVLARDAQHAAERAQNEDWADEVTEEQE